MTEHEIKPDTSHPVTAAFRKWVRSSIEALDTSALSVGLEAGLGKNTLGDFLRGPARDINLTTTHVITCIIQKRAAAQGVALPKMVVRFDG